jgi:hypothetical protein
VVREINAVKWEQVLGALGFVDRASGGLEPNPAGVDTLAGGRVVGNQGASKLGVSRLVTAVCSLVVDVGLFPFLSGFGAV